MINSNNVTLYGKCIKALPGVKFQVKLHDLSKNLNLSFLSNKIVIAKVCGRMINKKIRLNVGDNVELEISIAEIYGFKNLNSINKPILGRIKKRLTLNKKPI